MTNPYDDLLGAEEQRVRQADAGLGAPAPAVSRPPPAAVQAPSAAAAPANPYDDLLQAEGASAETRQQAVLRTAAGTNPDQAGEANRLARRYPAPQDVLLRNLQDVKLQAAVEDASKNLVSAPALARQMQALPFAQVAHDDTENLSLLEKALGAGSAGLHTAARGVAGVFQGISELDAFYKENASPLAPVFRWWEESGQFGGNPSRRLAEGFALIGAANKESARVARPKSTGPVEAGFYSGLESLTQTALTLPLAFLPGGQPAALTGMVSFTGGDAYQTAREQGMPLEQALPFAASQAAIEYATERIPLTRLIGDVKAGAPILKTVVHQLASEIPGEQVATVLQDLNEWAALPENKDKPFADYLKDRPSAAAQTLVATIVGVGGNIAVAEGVGKAARVMAAQQDKADRAEVGAATIEQLNALAGASKVLQRDPESFAAFVESAAANGPVSDVFISAEALAQSGHAEEVAAASPAVAAQFAAALETGADIRIPVAEYATTIAPQSYAQNLVDHLKVEADGLSRAEAQEVMKTQGDALRQQVEDALTNRDEAQRSGRQAVEAKVMEQLTAAKRFTEQVNQQYASLAGAFYATQAGRLGITPEEMFDRHPLRVQATSPVGDRLSQSEDTFAPQELPPPASVAEDLRGMVAGAFWAQQGGEMIRDPRTAIDPDSPNAHREGDVVGRTPWIPAQEWFARMRSQLGRGGLSKQGDIAAAVEKAIRGEKLKAAEQRTVDWIRQELQSMQAAIAAARWVDQDDATGLAATAAAVGLGVADAEDLAKTARAAEIDPAAIERAAVQYENDDAAFMLAVQEILDANAAKQTPDQSASAGEGGPRPRQGEANQSPRDEGLIRVTGLPDGARGAFTPGANVISLFKGADLTTFLHELGHFQLEVLADLASQPDAPAGVKADMQALLDWFGVKADTPEGALETWHRMTLDEKRAGHEQFARGFEAYLFEGKAPSVELRGVFQRFRAWLINVYRSLKALNVELNDEVRAVMDRLLATEDQIHDAQAAASMGLLFKTPEEAAKFGIEWEAYHSQADAATAAAVDALAERGVKDMQWLSRAKNRELKRLQKDAEAKRREVEAEARAEVMAQPVYQAWQYLTGKHPVEPVEADRYGKLNTAGVRARYGTEDGSIARALAERGMLKSDGEDPDITAELFGYDSGDAMMQALAAAKPPEQAVADLADQRMLERYGDITSPQALETAATEAIHNTARAKFLATELKALQAANDARAPAGADKKGRPRTAAILPEVARQFAADLIARLKVRDVRPGQYQSAEARAGREADKALKAGDVVGAAREKRNQLINHHAAKEAIAAQNEVTKALRYFARAERSDGIDTEYRDQIDQLLTRFSLKREPLKAIDKRKSLQEWVDQQRERGFEPDIPAELLAGLGRTSYKDMTVEEIRGLVDTIKQIEHMGRLKKRLLTARDQREYEVIRDEMAASVEANARGRTADIRTPTTNLGRWFQGLKNFGAAHIKAATWARIFDGNQDGGPVWEHLIRPANERGDWETTRRAEATQRLHDILKPWRAEGKTGGKGTFFPSINSSKNREAVLAIALNTGNAGNLQRLLGGEGWTLDQLKPVLDTLTETDWKVVQQVWDYFESFRPEIAAKERRVYGKEPNWVEPTPVVTKFGTLKGGYYPIKYDPAASARAEENADAEEAAALLKGAHNAATTRRSFTKSRIDAVQGRPLVYTLSGLYSGVNDVIHDLAWHEWLIDANRLLRSEKIDSAIREHYGPAVVKQLRSWRDDIAKGDAPAAHAVDQASAFIRRNVSLAGLALNVKSALMQPLGFTQSIVRIGGKAAARGIAQYVANPVAATRSVNAQSEFMRNRSRTRFRELNEIRGQVQGGNTLQEHMAPYAYVLMLRMQQMVDVPTWLGAYEKAVAEGNDDERAVALADQAVIDSQGGGQFKDLAAIERGGPTQKLFTVFYAFMNTALNLGVAQGLSPRSAAKKAVDMVLLFVVPAILGQALANAMTPGDSGDEDDLVKKLVQAQAEFLLGLMVGLRELAPIVRALSGEPGADYQGPAGLRPVVDLGKFAVQARQGEFDDSFRKASVNLTADLLGLPGAQINRTITGAQALNEGKTENPGALLLGYQEPH